jgi:hypothetical protein
MLTSDPNAKAANTLIPSVIEIIKDIVALHYLLCVDTLLYGTARALLNIQSVEHIRNNIFYNTEAESNKTFRLGAVKVVGFVGASVLISMSVLLAFATWESACFNNDFFHFTDDDSFLKAQLNAQRCKSVLENFVVPSDLELNAD